MGKRVMVLIGTRKGTFIAESDAGRKDWSIRGPMAGDMFKFDENMEFPVNLVSMDVNYDAKTGTLYSATASSGGNGNYEAKIAPAVRRSTDFGETWTASSEGLT